MTQQAPGAQSPATGAAEPSGIGGWLILPTIGLVLTLLRGGPDMFATYSGVADALPLLSSGQRAFIVGEIIFNVATVVLIPVVLLVLLFLKKRAFVPLFVVWGIVGLVGMFLDLILAKMLFPSAFPTVADLFDEKTTIEFFRSLILAGIWVPYMLKSRRVSNTFVN